MSWSIVQCTGPVPVDHKIIRISFAGSWIQERALSRHRLGYQTSLRDGTERGYSNHRKYCKINGTEEISQSSQTAPTSLNDMVQWRRTPGEIFLATLQVIYKEFSKWKYGVMFISDPAGNLSSCGYPHALCILRWMKLPGYDDWKWDPQQSEQTLIRAREMQTNTFVFNGTCAHRRAIET